MDNGTREFDELRNILQKLDRSLDEAQHKRQHGSTPPPPGNGAVPGQRTAPSPGHYPDQIGGREPISPAGPASTHGPAVIPDRDQDAEQPGRLKAKPLRRNRPESAGPSHGWVH